MHLKVDLIPRGPYQGVVIVVDVLRATTTTPLLFEKGLKELFIRRAWQSFVAWRTRRLTPRRLQLRCKPC
jgi:phosphosulfolactate phosphohydrolase-like enzyme